MNLATANREMAHATSADRIRQVGVTISALACIFGTLLGMGVIGTRVEESSGGALADDATLLAPMGPAFSIWSVIYLGLIVYTVWQWLPAQTTDPRHRAIGWLAAVSMVLNAAWLLVTQQGWIWISVAVIAALVLVLGLLVRRLTTTVTATHRASEATDARTAPDTSTAERVVVDGTFGLYLGWVMVATCANITAAFVSSGIEFGGVIDEIAALAVLVAIVAIMFVVQRYVGPRWAVAAAAVWGLAWIAVGRIMDSPESVLVAVGAVVAAAGVVAAVPASRRTPTPAAA